MNRNPDKVIQNKISKILLQSGFNKVDKEVHFSFSPDHSDNFSIDVAAIHDDHLILIECKTTYRDADLTGQIDHAVVNRQEILRGQTTKLIKSGLKKFNLNDIKKIKHVHYGFVFENTGNNDEKILKKLDNKNMTFWNSDAITHFYNSAKILGDAAKYEILREFKIKPNLSDFHAEDAIKIEQNGHEIFMFGLHPSKLLQMCYVYRRTSNRPSSYQRIISKNRLPEISKFYKNTKNLLLANSVIIAFDGSPEIQKEVNYDHGQLRFPIEYSCAWIIDGQHRVYAFKNTKYANPSYKKKQFKIPVIAFKELPSSEQSRTFVDVNYYQKKIDTVLIYDLVSQYADLKYELTWPALLVKKLNLEEPWKNLIKTSQNDPARRITIAGFVRPVLFEKLLGFNSKSEKFEGPLYKISMFDNKKLVNDEKNQKSLAKQLDVLKRFFSAVKKHANTSNNKWDDDRKYGLTRFPGVNALLLVLYAILRKYPKGNVNFDKYMSVIKHVNFSNKRLKALPRGYSVVNTLAEDITRKLNQKMGETFIIPRL